MMKEETSLILEKIRDDAKQFFASVNYPSKREDSALNELHVQLTKIVNNENVIVDYDEPIENEDLLWDIWEKIKKDIQKNYV